MSHPVGLIFDSESIGEAFQKLKESGADLVVSSIPRRGTILLAWSSDYHSLVRCFTPIGLDVRYAYLSTAYKIHSSSEELVRTLREGGILFLGSDKLMGRVWQLSVNDILSEPESIRDRKTHLTITPRQKKGGVFIYSHPALRGVVSSVGAEGPYKLAGALFFVAEASPLEAQLALSLFVDFD